MSEHDCKQEPRIERTENLLDIINKSLGGLETLVKSIPGQYKRLDARINGSFKAIGKHMDDGPVWRDRIQVLEIKADLVEKSKQEKTRAREWRIGLICGIPAFVLVALRIADLLIKWFNLG